MLKNVTNIEKANFGEIFWWVYIKLMSSFFLSIHFFGGKIKTSFQKLLISYFHSTLYFRNNLIKLLLILWPSLAVLTLAFARPLHIAEMWSFRNCKMVWSIWGMLGFDFWFGFWVLCLVLGFLFGFNMCTYPVIACNSL